VPRDDDDQPVTRRDLERALRAIYAMIADGRDDLLRLAAEVVAGASGAEVAAEVERVLTADENNDERVHLARFADKYDVENAQVPCAELMPICHAVCCKLDVVMSTQDLDEGVLRWDYGRPYILRHADHGWCVHHDRATGACGAHEHRPALCREYSCKDDKRIWADFERRILAAPVEHLPLPGDAPGAPFDLHARAKRRQVALAMENASLRRR
jgi:Fe-S-cluster containining protein